MVLCGCSYICMYTLNFMSVYLSVVRKKRPLTLTHSLKTESSWWQLCRNWWLVATKLASWTLSVFVSLVRFVALPFDLIEKTLGSERDRPVRGLVISIPRTLAFISSPPGQNDRLFADDIFTCILVNNFFLFWLKFHWCLFLRVQLTITQYWFR